MKKIFGRFGKIWKDLLDFSAKPTEGVCLTAQKFCKSEQIEQY